MRWAALALAALALSGCETTQEKSAKLEKVAKAHGTAHTRASSLSAAALAHASPGVTVTASTVLHSSEGTAAVITLHNGSATALRDIPIEVIARNADGSIVYTNTTAGVSPTLVRVPLLGAHASLSWIDDQVQASSTPTSVSARLGEGQRVHGSTPALTVTGHLTEASDAFEGQVRNQSAVEQRELAVYCVARRDGRIVAAGRAVLAQVPAHASARFEIFFIGDATGATLELLAPPSTIG